MQATLRERVEFDGVGLHTGVDCRAAVVPATPDAGLTFVCGNVRVPALVENVVDTSRATVIGRDGAIVSTTEHLLSALFAMGVSNADIVVEGPEIPICDGSAAVFCERIAQVGIAVQDAERATLELTEPVFVRDGDKLVAAFPAPSLRVRFLADFPEPIGTQYFYDEIDSDSYAREVAAARTFAYLHEVQALLERGLARGGSLENALVFAPDGPMQPLRWHNEAVRHKTLDLIGDLALLGAWPQCEILAVKSGHELHASMMRALRDHSRALFA
jgi:UDP-3-O-[3-hydroxymyristoyl] N-acetylglucosamine deacetylase